MHTFIDGRFAKLHCTRHPVSLLCWFQIHSNSLN